MAAAIALTASAALAQNTPQVSVNPNNGPPGSTTTLTLSNFDLLPPGQCNTQAPTEATCIYVKFEQGSRPPVVIAVATGSNSSAVRIPAACTAPANTNCSDPGPANIHAHSPNGQDASTGFTVGGTAASTTSSTAASTTTSSSTSSSTTTTSSSSSTTVTTVVLPAEATTTTIAPKKASSSHSDVPRYIAVALVVLAAAGTAAVDTQLRRMNAPPPGPDV